ncbi:hypothetical protein HOG21_01350 [bacterium]|nr:hypothetical protein [bacterium]
MFNTDNSLDNHILPPTPGKLFFVKFEARFSYLPHELILHIDSDQDTKVSNTMPV